MPARAGLALLAALAVVAPASGGAAKCRTSSSRCAGKPKPSKPKPNKAKKATGWHNGTYDGGPGDPIIAPLPG